MVLFFLAGFPCKICPPGSFNNVTRAQACDCCPDGYSSTYMKTSCRPCPANEWAKHESFPNCSMCQTCFTLEDCEYIYILLPLSICRLKLAISFILVITALPDYHSRTWFRTLRVEIAKKVWMVKGKLLSLQKWHVLRCYFAPMFSSFFFFLSPTTSLLLLNIFFLLLVFVVVVVLFSLMSRNERKYCFIVLHIILGF